MSSSLVAVSYQLRCSLHETNETFSWNETKCWDNAHLSNAREKRREIKLENVIFTWSVHTWREPDGRVERVHGRRWHSQTGEPRHSTATDVTQTALRVVMVESDGAHAHTHVHGVRIGFGEVGHDVGRIINFRVVLQTIIQVETMDVCYAAVIGC